MALIPADALNPGVRRREFFGWAMYDFANSGYTTVVITAVFAAYFVGGIAGNAPWGPFAWTVALSTSYAIAVLTLPTLGAYADLRAAKKRMLVYATVGCVTATLLLAFTPQMSGTARLVAAMVLVVISNTFYSYGDSFIASFLPEIARPERMGAISGWGWSLGYVGGMLALGLSLGYVLWAQSVGAKADDFVPITLLITAAIYLLASCVTFSLLKERAVPNPDALRTSGLAASVAQLKHTFAQAREYRDFMWLLACSVAYQGGVAVAISLAAIYAEQVIGFKATETMVLIFVLNIAAALGAFGFGYLQDKIGHKTALAITLVGWIITCLIAAWSQTKGQFWWAATIAGLCMGSSQSVGRALAGTFAPVKQTAEFFGLWGFSGKLASILGPLTYGAITWATGGNQRVAIVSTALLFIIGLICLVPVNVARGRAQAQAANSAA